MPIQRKNLFDQIDLFAILAVIVPLFVYLLTLAPTVTFFDSGEFLTAIASLGTPHSPGYPLFVNYAKPFTFLPLGDIAFRINFATAVSAALACLGVHLLTLRVLADGDGTEREAGSRVPRKAAALSAALAFAFSPRLWLQSNHDKPYPLLTFIVALVFLLLLHWRENCRKGVERPGYVYPAAFLCGLAMGAHQTIVLLLPSFAFIVLATDWRIMTRIREQILSLGAFLVGFSVYLHLPLRATQSPLLNWGDPKTLTQFLWNFLRKGYPMEHVDRDWPLLLKQLSAFNLVNEFTALGFFLLLAGAVFQRRRARVFLLAFGIAVVSFLAFVVGYQNTPEEMIFLTEEFFTPLYLMAAVLVGLGIFSLAEALLEWLHPATRRTRVLFVPALLLLVMLLPAVQCAGNFSRNDQHENYLAYDYAVNTFRSLPHGAVLFTWGDSGAFPLWYLQGVEHMREDLLLLHVPHLQFHWYLDSFPKIFRESPIRELAGKTVPLRDVLQVAFHEQLGKRPVFIDFSTRYSIEPTGIAPRQRGICYELVQNMGAESLVPDVSVWDTYSLRSVSGDTIAFRDLDSEKAVQIYRFSRLEGGRTLLARGMRKEGKSELLKAEAMTPALHNEVVKILSDFGVR
ncbi:MAG TPA: DUF2723 domain-containing protein [Geobacteraceae bacterium]|nr:DUF2723 domain-containing protein [Geobacteraceae bacterium]